MAYKLFTDAGGRIVNEQYWVSLAGIVLNEKNNPICEFLIMRVQKDMSEIEVSALMHGLALINDFSLNNNIKNWEIYSDSKGSIKKMQGDARKIPLELTQEIDKLKDSGCHLTFTHIERKMNTYANALANYHYNCYIFGDKAKGIHGINRAKKVFFARLKAGYAINVTVKKKILSNAKKIEDLSKQLANLLTMEPHPIRNRHIEKMQLLLNSLKDS